MTKNLYDESTDALRIAGLMGSDDDVQRLEGRREKAKNQVAENATREFVVETKDKLKKKAPKLTEAPLDREELDLSQAAHDVFRASNLVEKVAKKIGSDRDKAVKELIKTLRDASDAIEEFVDGPLGNAQDELGRMREDKSGAKNQLAEAAPPWKKWDWGDLENRANSFSGRLHKEIMWTLSDLNDGDFSDIHSDGVGYLLSYLKGTRTHGKEDEAIIADLTNAFSDLQTALKKAEQLQQDLRGK